MARRGKENAAGEGSPAAGLAARTFTNVPKRVPVPRPGDLAALLQVASASDSQLRLRTRDGVHLFVAASGIVSLVVWAMMAIRWSAVLLGVSPRHADPKALTEAVLLWLLFGAWGVFGLYMLVQGGKRVTIDRKARSFSLVSAWGLRRRNWDLGKIPAVRLELGTARRRAARLFWLRVPDSEGKRVLELGPVSAGDREWASLTRIAAQIARVASVPLVVEGWAEGEEAPPALADLADVRTDEKRRAGG